MFTEFQRAVRRSFANAKTALKGAWAVTTGRTVTAVQQRYNPLRGMTPEILIRALDQYQLGYLRDAARIWDIQEQRDDMLRTVAGKRKADVARLTWEILTVEGADQAQAEAQREVLARFYNRLRAGDALRGDLRGGVRLLVTQMMDARGKGYAVHENALAAIEGRARTRDAVRAPVVLRGRAGQAAFPRERFALYGRDLEPGGWLVTATDPLMPAASLAAYFKTLPLRDWLVFCEKYGIPGVLGSTDASPGSPQWEAMETAVAAVIGDWSAVKSHGDEIQLLEAKGGASALPFPPLVEYLDRKIAMLWRGADLSTMSKGGQGVGASLQGDESAMLAEDDATWISETLNEQIDRTVLRWHFGDSVEPLAYFRLVPPKRQNVDADLKVDAWLLSAGAPMAIKATLERYSRPMPDAGEDLLKAPAPPPGAGTSPGGAAPGAAASPSLTAVTE